MDSIDRKILSLLQANARMPISDIANSVGRSRTVVSKRIEQLIADGEITQFTIKVKEQTTKPIAVLFKVKNAQGYSCHQVVPAFQQAYPIVQALSISGEEWDVLIQAEFANSEELNLAKNFLDSMEGVASAVTHLILHKFV